MFMWQPDPMLAAPGADPNEQQTSVADPSESRGLSRRRKWLGVVLCLCGLPLLTFLLVAFRDDIALESVLLVYLLAVVIIAVVGGVASSLLGAVTSFFLANWFLTPPFHTLQVETQDRLIELVVFVVVAVLVSVTVELGARNRVGAEQRLLLKEAQARRLAETDRLRSTLLAAVGHDLRTPLSGIKAAASTLRQPDLTWTAVEEGELLRDIEDSTDRLTLVITNLLAMSRIRSGAVSVHLAPVALDHVVAAALVSLGDGDEDLHVPEELPPVLADSGLLERVLANLIANARRFSPPGHPVSITAAPGEGRTVDLRIADRGPGVPENRWEEIFQPFHSLGNRRSADGLGMGLAIARGLTRPMGIDVTPAETPGGGLTMTVTMAVA